LEGRAFLVKRSRALASNSDNAFLRGRLTKNTLNETAGLGLDGYGY
jgi:hypothetical protein